MRNILLCLIWDGILYKKRFYGFDILAAVMDIIFLGSGEFGLCCLEALQQSRHKPVFIVSQPPHPAGRGRKQRPTAVAQWAAANSIPFLETDNVNTEENISRIASLNPDLIVVIAFGQKIGNDLIDLPAKGAINVHASLLPRYRGAAPINRAIINGDEETGISIIELAEKMDAGDILGQVKTKIKPGETAGELHNRLAELAAPLLLETIDKIADASVVRVVQDHSRATLAPKLKKSDGLLDFTKPAEVLYHRILGFWPWPGASAHYVSQKSGKTERVIIAEAEVIDSSNKKQPGPGVFDENLNVSCGEGALKIKKIKPAGGRLMDFAAFVNGRGTSSGDFLTNSKPTTNGQQ